MTSKKIKMWLTYWSIAATCGFAGMLTLPILMSGASFSSIAACRQHPRDHTRLFAPVQVGPVQELKRRRAAWHCTRLLRPRTPYPGNPDMPSTQSVYPPPQKWYWICAADVPSVAAPVLGYTRVPSTYRDRGRSHWSDAGHNRSQPTIGTSNSARWHIGSARNRCAATKRALMAPRDARVLHPLLQPRASSCDPSC